MNNEMSAFVRQPIPANDATSPFVSPQPVAVTPTHAPVNLHGHQALGSLGPLDRLLEDERVQDILVNGTHSIFVDINGQLEDSGVRFDSHEALMDAAHNIMAAVGQRWSEDIPMIDTRLPDGSRVNMVAPPMAVDGLSISIRKFPKSIITLQEMVQREQITQQMLTFLHACVEKRLNIIVSGGTGTGKTTIINALSGSIGPKERIVTIEDSAEMRLQSQHVVRLEVKTKRSASGAQDSFAIRDLVKNALRMRPDRIVVGETRGAEAFDMLQAMNTGHEGSMTTLHANSPREALSRLETMITLAAPQLPVRLVRQQIAASVNLIFQMVRLKDGQRRIERVCEIAGMEGEMIVMQDLIVFTPNGTNAGSYKWTAGSSRNPIVTEAARAAGFLRSFG
jgi:pilus assembly protein CpaF